MKIYFVRKTAFALSLLAGGLTGLSAQAQSVIYTNPYAAGHTYGLINTDSVALYINDRGDLGAPYHATGTIKPNGLLDGNGQPYINADGSINTSAQSGTYGMLISDTPVTGAGSVGASVHAKSEYLTGGSSNVAEGFALYGDNSRLHSGTNWINASNFTVNSFSAQNTANPGLVSQLFRQTGSSTTQGLQITQTAMLIASTNSIRFDIVFKNTDAQSLTNLRYARGVNANPSASSGGNGNTQQFFGSAADPTAFLIGSGVGNKQVSFAVHQGDPNAIGSRVAAAATASESGLLSNPDRFFGASNRYVTLGSGLSATYNVGNGTTQTTSDFSTDGSFQPDFGTLDNGDYGILIESGIFNLQAGESTNFSYYLEAQQRMTSSGVPEPGTLALLAAGLSVGLLLRRRRA